MVLVEVPALIGYTYRPRIKILEASLPKGSPKVAIAGGAPGFVAATWAALDTIKSYTLGQRLLNAINSSAATLEICRTADVDGGRRGCTGQAAAG